MAEESGGAKTQSRLVTVTAMVQVLSIVAGVVISVAAFFAAQAKEAERRTAEAETRQFELRKLERDEKNRTEQAAREALRPFLQLRQERYLDAVRVAAVLVSPQAHTADEVRRAHDRFFELYWGELSVVEDSSVATAMVALGRAIDPKAIVGTDAQTASLDLAHALRDSLVRSWHVDDIAK